MSDSNFSWSESYVLNVSNEISSAASNNKGDFCNNDNINHCVAYLCQELQALGLNSLYENGSSSQWDSIKLVNSIYSLLRLQSKERIEREEILERLHRSHFDFEIAQKEIGRFKDKVEQAERNAATVKETNRQLAIKIKLLQGDLRGEKDENKRLTTIIQQRDAQYHHELRRKERETASLKDRLHQAISDKGAERRIGMTISNVLPRLDGKRGTWQTKTVASKNEDDLHKKIMSGYENRNKLLMEENVLMRETLSKIFKQISELESVQGSDTSSSEAEDISKWFRLPYTQTVNKIEFALEEKSNLLKKRLADGACKSNGDDAGCSPDTTECLERKIAEYELLIERQRKGLEAAVSIEGSPNPRLNDWHLLEERETFLKERTEFLEMKGNFQKERRIFTDAALRLAKDRQSFTKEKKDFEEWRDNQNSPIGPSIESSTTKIASSVPLTTINSTTKAINDFLLEFGSPAKNDGN